MPEPVLTVSLLMATGYAATAALSRSGTAVSREAAVVRQNATKVVERAEQSVALFGVKSRALTALASTVSECSEENWDGYGALPVERRALELAVEIIRSIPDGLPMPEFAIEPDGSVSMDWMPTPRRTFTLSLGKNSRIPYAWVDGTDHGHGVVRLEDGRIPARLIGEIQSICRHESAIRVA